jgi:hypothetical protein
VINFIATFALRSGLKASSIKKMNALTAEWHTSLAN